MNNEINKGEKLEALCQILLDNDWKESPDIFMKNSRCFFKKFEALAECNTNGKGNGIQVCVSVSNYRAYDHDTQSVEVNISAEHKDESWIEIKNYGVIIVPENIEEVNKLAGRLVKTWETFASSKL
jgi:hypothetical protein